MVRDYSGSAPRVKERAWLRRMLADALIAAYAWEHGLIPATRNTGDFSGFGIPVLNPFEYGG